MAKIIATCMSNAQAKPKKNVHQVTAMKQFGVSGDYHAVHGEFQISVLFFEELEKLGQSKDYLYGNCGENFLVKGLDQKDIKIGCKLVSADMILQVEQIGKKTNTDNTTQKDCVMGKVGLFCTVLHAGIVTEDDDIYID